MALTEACIRPLPSKCVQVTVEAAQLVELSLSSFRALSFFLVNLSPWRSLCNLVTHTIQSLLLLALCAGLTFRWVALTDEARADILFANRLNYRLPRNCVTVRGRKSVRCGCTGLLMATQGVVYVSAVHYFGLCSVEDPARAFAADPSRSPSSPDPCLVPSSAWARKIFSCLSGVDAPVGTTSLLSPVSTPLATISGALAHP